jgi:hypothetical protein
MPDFPRTATFSGITVQRLPARLVVTDAPAATVITLAQVQEASSQLVTIDGDLLDFGRMADGSAVIYKVVDWQSTPPGLIVELQPVI